MCPGTFWGSPIDFVSTSRLFLLLSPFLPLFIHLLLTLLLYLLFSSLLFSLSSSLSPAPFFPLQVVRLPGPCANFTLVFRLFWPFLGSDCHCHSASTATPFGIGIVLTQETILKFTQALISTYSLQPVSLLCHMLTRMRRSVPIAY